jgi:hypothetical protein
LESVRRLHILSVMLKIVCATLLWSSIAAADPSDASAVGVPLSPSSVHQSAAWTDEAEHSPVGATLISAGTTAISLAVLYAGMRNNDLSLLEVGYGGLMVTPSLGHIYGDPGHVTTEGVVARGVGTGIMMLGALLSVPNDLHAFGCISNSANEPCNSDRTGPDIVLAGLAVVVAGAVIDIATAGPATQRHNERHRAAVSVTPTVMRTADRSMAGGVALGGTF